MTALTEREAQYKRRLESFSDVVFGLSLSVLALQLGLPHTSRELIADPLRYVIFFGSFAIVCSLWVSHHRMFRLFRPNRITVGLNFLYLAFTVLMPFGMQALLTFHGNHNAFELYAAFYSGTAATMCVLLAIGIRESSAHISRDELVEVYGHFLRQFAICVLMVAAFIILLCGAIQIAGYTLFLIFPAIQLMRRLRGHVPRFFTPAASQGRASEPSRGSDESSAAER